MDINSTKSTHSANNDALQTDNTENSQSSITQIASSYISSAWEAGANLYGSIFYSNNNTEPTKEDILLKMKASLSDWVNDANAKPSEKRRKASENILRAYRNNYYALDLKDYDLNSLPPEIGYLSKLKELNLEGNRLKQLPPEIGNLSNLEVLNLYNNLLKQLSPEIGYLSKLKELNLWGNRLKQLPPEIGNLSNLELLNLGYNKISILSHEFYGLSKLKTLDLDDNQLTQLPPEIKNLHDLEKLNLNSNRLLALPPELCELSSLKVLHLKKNQLVALPSNFGKLSNLNVLTLFENRLNQLPLTFYNLLELEELSLSTNQFTELPSAFGNFAKLKFLGLGHNQLSQLPPEIGKLSNLERLALSFNHLNDFPSEFGNFAKLNFLSLEHNQLSQLPPEIGKLSNLEQLDLSFNQLNDFPSEFGNLAKLKFLHLEHNQLSHLPSEFGNLSNLARLALENTPLTELPSEILDLPSTCTIPLINTGLSEAVLGRLRERVTALGYNGPRFHFSMTHAENRNPNLRSKETLLKELFDIAGVEEKTFDQLIPAGKETTLVAWLSRLSFMADFRKGGEKQQKLTQNILSYLELANNDPDFRESFFNTIEGAGATCGDRVALSILKLDINYQLATIKLDNPKAVAELLRTSEALHILEDIARGKVKTLPFVDEIEVYLAYPVKLKERLNLNIQVDEMLYFTCSGVTDDDLNFAAEVVGDQLDNKELFAELLLEYPIWKDTLQEKCSKELDEIEAKAGALLDAEKYEEAMQVRSEMRKDLTMELLG